MLVHAKTFFRLIAVVVGIPASAFLLILAANGAIGTVLGLIGIGALLYGALHLMHWVVVVRPTKRNNGQP